MRLRKAEEPKPIARAPLNVVCADPETGLTDAEVLERQGKGYANDPVNPPTKTVKQIIISNVFTYFNLLFFILAAFIIAVGSWRNLMFMPVVIANMGIGVVQEIRTKRQLDKLTLISMPKGVAVRNGGFKTLSVHDMVRDDIVVFTVGNQVFADAEVVSGEVLSNEALVTGEADEIKKLPGDELLSGSFIVGGTCRARLTRIGADSYAAQLTIDAKKVKQNKQSEMMESLGKLVKWIGIIILPFGAALCFKEVSLLGRSFQDGVTSTVGALVGMIPEGLYLLTSLALAAGVVRLAQKKTLVQDLNCIETLARVDVLCVDKTGTITENKMIVEDICLLCEDRFNEDDIRLIMSDYVGALGNENDTMDALMKYFSGDIKQKPERTLPFTSKNKYSGVSFHEDETYLLGAPEIILGEFVGDYGEIIDFYSERGCRVLLLALYDGDLESGGVSGDVMPLSLILLGNKIRDDAPETFKYFTDQGVCIKVISGDNPKTVSEVAKRAEIEGAELFVDARTLTDDKMIKEAATKYIVFGRVTPEQKKKLVRAMKDAGHTVAMTGDGINDILALKEADCSIAMASGSEVASQVSHIVLLNSKFSAMPSVVAEGRRVINNIERAAALFLVKNIFSFLLALISLFFTLPYPVTPAQLSLVSTLTIGIPSFMLALEPNDNMVSGKFLSNVIYKGLPAGITNVLLVVGVLLFYISFSIDSGQMSTICAIILGVVGLLMLGRVCKPLNDLRRLLLIAMCAAFLLCILFLGDLFTLSDLNFSSKLILVVFTLLAYPVMYVVTIGMTRAREIISEKLPKLKRKNVKA